MKKILSIILASCLLLGCSESFLDTENLTKKNSQNFPVSLSDAQQVLTSAYNRVFATGDNVLLYSELMSDDRLGAGGSDDRIYQAVDRFMKVDEEMFASMWRDNYAGIYRVNFLFSTLDQIEWENEADRALIEAECYFLRANFYFNLARFFGNVPLVLDPTPQNNPQIEPVALYGQIASDFKNAIAKFPSTPYQNVDRGRLGHATKWAAQALAARMFLFYTGYYNAASIPLPEGGELSKAEVIGWVDDCIANSGHGLISDFRNLWPYSISQDYAYAKENNLKWVDETGDNIEAIFVVKHSPSTSNGRSSIHALMGLRYQPDYNVTYPFGQGWGIGSVNPNTYEEWSDNDLRKKGSILNINDPTESVTYTYGCQNHVEETGFLQKKYTPITMRAKDGSGNVESYARQLYGTNYDFASDNFQDNYVIRFADVLLMGAELGSAKGQEYLDRVRARVNLPSVPLTLENIKAERRWELAFEGLRYFDLLRWHDEDVITKNQTNVPVSNMTVAATVSIKFRPETGGFVQIPLTQIELSDGVLVQNKGWEGSAYQY